MQFRILFIFLSLFLSTTIMAQIKGEISKKMGRTVSGRQLNDTIGNNKFGEENLIEFDEKTHYTEYKIISYVKDTTVIDTTLSLKKERLFNHLRKDLFEYQSLHNLGTAYNVLGYDFNQIALLPKIGASVKHQDFIEVQDVNYFRVPTPTSELFFKTGIQQGQILNSVLTTNITPELNISVAYKGLRSLGDYQSALASHQNARFTGSFQNKSNRYRARVHFVSHSLLNQENGGLKESSILLFTTNDANYTDRKRLEVNYTGAESLLKAKRYYLEQTYDLWKKKDTTKKRESSLQVGHEFVFSRKHYKFNQEKVSSYIGEAFQSKIADSTYHKTLDNSLFIKLKTPYILGDIGFKTTLSNYKYGSNSRLHLENQTIPNQLKGNLLTTEAHWNASFKTFSLQSKAGVIISGNINGNYLSGKATYSKDSLFTASATLSLHSRAPNYNFQLFQSDYIAYNWHSDLKNELTQFLGFSFFSKKLVDIEASMSLKENYTYFDTGSQPKQYTDVLNYAKVKVHKAIKLKRWTLDNTVLYQKALSGDAVFRVPELITENTLFYTDYIFKGDPLFLQTGFTFKYFTQYKANEFDALLNEFKLQDDINVGNYPMLDFFVNGQIRRTRLYLKAENITSFFTGHSYFATPNQPYRDFKIRFGVVWNFFI